MADNLWCEETLGPQVVTLILYQGLGGKQVLQLGEDQAVN